MLAIISFDTIFPFDNPRKTSASTKASINETELSCEPKSNFSASSSVLFLHNNPLLSNMKMFSYFAPNVVYNFAQDIAAAPAPEMTIFTSFISLLANSNAFNNAAEEMIAVPCWSSCITGISNSSFNLLSISNASGALMSSKLIPPKVGDIAFTVCINNSGSLASISMSKTSMSANILNRTPFPSITGLEANGPMSPKPRTAVPLEITATKFPLAVYL